MIPPSLVATVAVPTVVAATKVWWYVSRASGVVAWLLAAMAVLWGLALSTRALGAKPRAPWLLDLHRFIGGTHRGVRRRAPRSAGTRPVRLVRSRRTVRADGFRVEAGRRGVGDRRLLSARRGRGHLAGPGPDPEAGVATRSTSPATPSTRWPPFTCCWPGPIARTHCCGGRRRSPSPWSCSSPSTGWWARVARGVSDARRPAGLETVVGADLLNRRIASADGLRCQFGCRSGTFPSRGRPAPGEALTSPDVGGSRWWLMFDYVLVPSDGGPGAARGPHAGERSRLAVWGQAGGDLHHPGDR